MFSRNFDASLPYLWTNKIIKKKVLYHEPVRSVLKMHVKCGYFDFCIAHLHLDFICLGHNCARGKWLEERRMDKIQILTTK